MLPVRSQMFKLYSLLSSLPQTLTADLLYSKRTKGDVTVEVTAVHVTLAANHISADTDMICNWLYRVSQK